jgi:hypothetical protein
MAPIFKNVVFYLDESLGDKVKQDVSTDPIRSSSLETIPVSGLVALSFAANTQSSLF